MSDGRLMLLDSATLYYRAFHALPTSMTGPDGFPNNAIRGFCDALPTLVNAVGANHLICAWDEDWRPQWRVDLWPGYKRHRLADEEAGKPEGASERPDELGPQVGAIADLLDSAGISRSGVDGFEADDVSASTAAAWAGEVVIVTSDRDLLQCVTDDSRVRVLSMARGLSNLQWFDAAAIEEKYSVAPHAYADFATLRGDSSDGLPGVPGIGEKTAASLIKAWGSLDEILAAAHDVTSDMTPRVRRSLTEAAANIPAWSQVTRARLDVAVPTVDATLPAQPRADFGDLVDSLGARRNISRWQGRLTAH